MTLASSVINAGGYRGVLQDNWIVVTETGAGLHFEHTVAITDDGADPHKSAGVIEWDS